MSYTPATEALISALQVLPGVGTRSAARMALQLLERDPESAQKLSEALQQAISRVHKCPQCRSLTEADICDSCQDENRDGSALCVVASDADRAAIDMSGQYRGRYFVLHGVLSPMDGVGPEQLGVFDLVERVNSEKISEVIIALDNQMEAEATAHYISEQLRNSAVKRSRIRFSDMRSGQLDQADSRVLADALSKKQEIGFEHD